MCLQVETASEIAITVVTRQYQMPHIRELERILTPDVKALGDAFVAPLEHGLGCFGCVVTHVMQQRNGIAQSVHNKPSSV